MEVKAIKTRPFLPPQDDLLSLITESVETGALEEKSVLVITSKIVSIWQGRCIKTGSVDKDRLIIQEADWYLEREAVPEKLVIFTVKDHLLMPTSGIDESNANDCYILWPRQAFSAAKELWEYIRQRYGLRDVGVIISDSRSMPLHLGVIGLAIAYAGFEPLRDYRGKPDVFGRKIKHSQTNMADSLAAAAVVQMGEGDEQTPLAVIRDIANIVFTDLDFSLHDPLFVDRGHDIYAPFFRSVDWKKGGGGAINI